MRENGMKDVGIHYKCLNFLMMHLVVNNFNHKLDLNHKKKQEKW
jgi:hypothetical protein